MNEELTRLYSRHGLARHISLHPPGFYAALLHIHYRLLLGLFPQSTAVVSAYRLYSIEWQITNCQTSFAVRSV